MSGKGRERGVVSGGKKTNSRDAMLCVSGKQVETMHPSSLSSIISKEKGRADSLVSVIKLVSNISWVNETL